MEKYKRITGKVFKGDNTKLRLHLDTFLRYPNKHNFELSISVNFKGFESLFLSLAQDVIYQDLQSAIEDVLQSFCETYLSKPGDAALAAQEDPDHV